MSLILTESPWVDLLSKEWGVLPRREAFSPPVQKPPWDRRLKHAVFSGVWACDTGMSENYSLFTGGQQDLLSPAQRAQVMALPTTRKWAEPRGCLHRALEHGLLGARAHRDSPERADNTRRDAHPPLTAQVGAHQPDWRLPLAQGRRARKPKVTSPQNQPPASQRHSLTCNF